MIFFLLTSCKKDDKVDNSSLLGKDYYPVTIGKYVEYDVDSTVYDSFTMTDTTFKYRIKEKIVSEFTDNEGKKALRLERYIKWFDPQKSYDSIPYMIKEVWMANYSDQNIQVSEGNIRYTKLVFPIQETKSWNGNAFNNLSEQTYRYEYVDKMETINSVQLAKVLKVDQQDDETLINKKVKYEKYSKGIGLVYREIVEIYSNNVVPGVPIEQRIESGVIYKQQIIKYGTE